MLIGLGVWQLQRAKWKEGLLARYAAGGEASADHLADHSAERATSFRLFRHATGVCLKPVGKRAMGGENLQGEPAMCRSSTARPAPKDRE